MKTKYWTKSVQTQEPLHPRFVGMPTTKNTNQATCRRSDGKRTMEKDLDTQAVLCIEAKDEDTLLKTLREIEDATLLSDNFMGHYEQDENSFSWKAIVTARFTSMNEVRQAVDFLHARNDVYMTDSSVLVDDEYVFCEGRYLDALTQAVNLSPATRPTDQ